MPPDFLHNPNGTASGTASASTDAHGAHVYTETGVSGQANTDVTASAGFSDTVYNPTNTAKEVQFTFHLDATLYLLSSASDDLLLSFNQQTLDGVQLILGGAGTYDYVDKYFTTPVLTIAANSYANWTVVLSAESQAISSVGVQYLAGLPSSYVDAGNTLSFTGISVMDAQGNQISGSGLTSYAGFDYSASSSSVASTPEPATIGLLGAACLGTFLGRKRLRKP